MSKQHAESQISATPASEDGGKFVYTVDELAEVFEVSTRTINRFVQQGMPRLAHGRYDLRACVQWQIARMKVEPATGEPSPHDVLAAARRDKVALETQQLRATLLPAREARELFTRMTEIVVDEFERVADVGDELAAIDDPSRIQAALHARSREARRAIAARIKALAADVEAGNVEADEEA